MKRRVTVRLRGPAARSSYLAEDVLDVRGVLGGGGGLAGLHGGAVHAAGRAARQLQHTLVSRPASLCPGRPRPVPSLTCCSSASRSRVLMLSALRCGGALAAVSNRALITSLALISRASPAAHSARRSLEVTTPAPPADRLRAVRDEY